LTASGGIDDVQSPYYAALIEGYGLKKEKDLYAYLLAQATVYSERMTRFNEVVNSGTDHFPRRQHEGFRRRSQTDQGSVQQSMVANWGAVPMTDEEFDALAADLKQVIVPELIIMAESKGELIGFALSLPDINVP